MLWFAFLKCWTFRWVVPSIVNWNIPLQADAGTDGNHGDNSDGGCWYLNDEGFDNWPDDNGDDSAIDWPANEFCEGDCIANWDEGEDCIISCEFNFDNGDDCIFVVDFDGDEKNKKGTLLPSNPIELFFA